MRHTAPRRILFATAGLHIGGGIASVSRCIALALDEQVEAGGLDPFDTVSLADDPATPPPSRRGRHARARGSKLRFGLLLWKALLGRRPDLVLLDHAGLARALRLPILGTARSRYAIFVHGGELSVITHGPRRTALEGADLVLANSEFTADHVREQFPAVAGRVRTVPLCIDPALVALWQRSDAIEPPKRQAAVLIVGRMWSSERGKGHDALVAAWPTIREHVPEAELWIAGQGDDVPRLQDLARKSGVGGSIRFLGGVSDEELGRLYRSASVFAMPSRQEGFGLVYAEALWHGLPCIASTRDAAREVVSDGRTGMLVPYGESQPLAAAIVRLLSEPALVQKMSVTAAADARARFTYPRFRRDLLAALGLAPSASG